MNRKRELAIHWLVEGPSAMAEVWEQWSDERLGEEMARQGFFWDEGRGSWFKRFEIETGEEPDHEFWMQRLSDGRFRWEVMKAGQSRRGVEATIPKAVMAAGRAMQELSGE